VICLALKQLLALNALQQSVGFNVPPHKDWFWKVQKWGCTSRAAAYCSPWKT